MDNISLSMNISEISLDHALHYEEYGSLSWGLRLRIALGIARALNYLHCTCIPPVAHSNLKAANVLCDEDLVPRICDCGLTVLKPLTSKNIKLKLHDNASLDQMVDPAIRGTIPPKALSRFADIVSLCVQPEKGFRPPISEILESLTHMMEDHRRGRSNPGDGTEDMLQQKSSSRALEPPDILFSCKSLFFSKYIDVFAC